MSEPVFELPDAPVPRPPVRLGWLFLWLIVGFLVVAQLNYYLTREPAHTEPYFAEDMELRQAVTVAETDRFMGGSKSGQRSNEGPRSQALKELDGTVSELAAKRRGDPDAALLYAAMRTEQGYAVNAEDLAALFRSKKRPYLAAAEAYVAKALTREAAESLSAEMKGDAFVWKLARIHALEKAGDKGVRARELPAGKIVLFMVMVLVLAGGVFVGGVLLLLFAVGSLAKRIVPKGFPLGQLNAEDADRCAMRVAQLLFLFIASGIFVEVVLGKGVPDVVRTVAAGAAGLGLALLLFKAPVGGKRMTLSMIGLKADNLVRDVLWGLAGALANAPLVVLSLGLTALLQRGLPPAEHPIVEELSKGLSLGSAVGYFLTAAMLAPLFEEICFRGVLTPALASVLRSPAWGIALSSLVFAAIHPTGVPAWPALAVIGATSAVLAYQTRSLVPSIVMHAAHNAALLLLSFALT